VEMTQSEEPAHVRLRHTTDDHPLTFPEVFDQELRRVNASRQRRGVTSTAGTDNLVGLAFSGGGLRSATFNLGLLQALAATTLLRKFDYLSTVSGGGYIGAWLAALSRRVLDKVPNASFQTIEQLLLDSESSALRWLRQYSNFLTPRTGLVSFETWARIATW